MSALSEKVGNHVVPLGTHGIYVEGNMANLSPTIPINISWTLGKRKNVYIGADFSPDEIKAYTELFKECCDVFSQSYDQMPGPEPQIIKRDIKTYPDSKLV